MLQAELRFRGFDVTQAQAAEIARAFGDTIKDFAKAGEDLHLTGIGTFHIIERASREFYSNMLKADVVTKRRRRIKFVPSKMLTLAANRDLDDAKDKDDTK